MTNCLTELIFPSLLHHEKLLHFQNGKKYCFEFAHLICTPDILLLSLEHFYCRN